MVHSDLVPLFARHERLEAEPFSSVIGHNNTSETSTTSCEGRTESVLFRFLELGSGGGSRDQTRQSSCHTFACARDHRSHIQHKASSFLQVLHVAQLLVWKVPQPRLRWCLEKGKWKCNFCTPKRILVQCPFLTLVADSSTKQRTSKCPLLFSRDMWQCVGVTFMLAISLQLGSGACLDVTSSS